MHYDKYAFIIIENVIVDTRFTVFTELGKKIMA